MFVEAHLQALLEGQVLLGTHRQLQLFRQHLPMAVAHAWIAQRLNQWDVGLELLDLILDINSHLLYIWEQEEKKGES